MIKSGRDVADIMKSVFVDIGSKGTESVLMRKSDVHEAAEAIRKADDYEGIEEIYKDICEETPNNLNDIILAMGLTFSLLKVDQGYDSYNQFLMDHIFGYFLKLDDFLNGSGE